MPELAERPRCFLRAHPAFFPAAPLKPPRHSGPCLRLSLLSVAQRHGASSRCRPERPLSWGPFPLDSRTRHRRSLCFPAGGSDAAQVWGFSRLSPRNELESGCLPRSTASAGGPTSEPQLLARGWSVPGSAGRRAPPPVWGPLSHRAVTVGVGGRSAPRPWPSGLRAPQLQMGKSREVRAWGTWPQARGSQ